MLTGQRDVTCHIEVMYRPPWIASVCLCKLGLKYRPVDRTGGPLLLCLGRSQSFTRISLVLSLLVVKT